MEKKDEMLQDLEKDLKKVLNNRANNTNEPEEVNSKSKLAWVGAIVAGLALFGLGGWLGHNYWPQPEQPDTTTPQGITTTQDGKTVNLNCIKLPLLDKGNTQIVKIDSLRQLACSDAIWVDINGKQYEIGESDSTKSYKEISSVWGANAQSDIVTLTAYLRDSTPKNIVDSVVVKAAGESLLQGILERPERQDLLVEGITLSANGVEIPIEIPNVSSYKDEATRSLRHAKYYFWVVSQVIDQVNGTQIDVNKIRF